VQELKSGLALIVKEMTMAELNYSTISNRILKVIKEFRQRCKGTYTEYLRTLDSEVRRILKPLVPSCVVDENIKYPKIEDLSLTVKSVGSAAGEDV
jgi:hypothetical protein